MYTVLIALSWWIKAQRNKTDPNPWAAVNDVPWVMCQLLNSRDLLTLQKQGCDVEDEGEEDNDQSGYKHRYVLLILSSLLVVNVFTSHL